MIKKIMLSAAALLPVLPVLASDLTTDNLTVSSNATVYGQLKFDYTVTGTNGSPVQLLLHCDGADGATTFTDLSTNHLNVAAYNNAQVDTSIKKFGTGALQVDNASYLDVWITNQHSFGDSDYTVDFWMYATGDADQRDELVQINPPMGGPHITVGAASGWGGGHFIAASFYYSGGWSLELYSTNDACDSVWHHIAVTRQGTSHKLFFDGKLDNSGTLTWTYPAYTGYTAIGGGHGDRYFNGYIDEVRIVKGLAAWTNDFTPPTQAYQDPSSSSGSSSSNVTTLTISSNGVNQVNAGGVNAFLGKVGIGTNNPAEKLHVAGNVQVDGSLKLGGEARTNWPSGAQGALLAANNLSDVADAAAARSNLGLGSAATNQANAFLTPTSDGSQLTNITAAQVGALSTNAGALLEANNLAELSDTASAARANLGLGSAATNDANAFLAPDGNGSQLTNITATQTGALSTNGGTMNGDILILYPGGDIPMGSYTNQ